MSELEALLQFISKIEAEHPDKSAYEIANKLRGYTRKHYTTRLWSMATGYHQDYIPGELEGKLDREVILSGKLTDFCHFIASLSDQINQPGASWSDLTSWSADHTSWAGDIGSAIVAYQAKQNDMSNQTLAEALERFAKDSDYTADIAAWVVGAMINSGSSPTIFQAIDKYNAISYAQHVRTFIQKRLRGIIAGKQLQNPADVEDEIAKAVFTFISLSNAPDLVKSFKSQWQSPSQLDLKALVKPNRVDVLQGSLHFLSHLIKNAGLDGVKFKPCRMPGTPWLGTLNYEVTVN
ncbi:MAG TPA: hypothetical protein DDZ80_00190 [Cyanobacteria bacterium UBA8803]|nr:hypothetical protein [Cyanobacteria bacterium UBA9273]HBL57036.1 hypothetical protein [Cyanobacteria bacterium UBA8803]